MTNIIVLLRPTLDEGGAPRRGSSLHPTFDFRGVQSEILELCQLFLDHGMELLGPPLVGEWKVDVDGRIVRAGAV